MNRAIAAAAAVLACAGAIVVVTAMPRGAAGLTDPLHEAIAASAAPGNHWQPGAARYGVSRRNGVAVRMADGTVLRADIATPSDPHTGRPATGPFPVLLTQTPYGKDTAGQVGSAAIGIDKYFVERGYLDVAVDVRGTGDSGGTF